MADIYDTNTKNKRNDLTTRTQDLTMRLTLGKVIEGKLNTGSLSFGKVS